MKKGNFERSRTFRKTKPLPESEQKERSFYTMSPMQKTMVDNLASHHGHAWATSLEQIPDNVLDIAEQYDEHFKKLGSEDWMHGIGSPSVESFTYKKGMKEEPVIVHTTGSGR